MFSQQHSPSEGGDASLPRPSCPSTTLPMPRMASLLLLLLRTILLRGGGYGGGGGGVGRRGRPAAHEGRGADVLPPAPPPPDTSPLPPSLSDRLAVMGGATDGLLPAEGVGVAAAPWDVEQARAALRDATMQLGRRGLKLASKWAAEQMVGLVPPLAGTGIAASSASAAGTAGAPNNAAAAAAASAGNNFATSGQESEATNDVELLAKALLECGEFRAAASALSSPPISSNDSSAGAGAGPGNTVNGGATSTAAKAVRAAVAIGAGRIGGGGDGGSSGDLVMGPPLPGLSALGTYLRAYSLYMAGEKRREEEMVELRCVT